MPCNGEGELVCMMDRKWSQIECVWSPNIQIGSSLCLLRWQSIIQMEWWVSECSGRMAWTTLQECVLFNQNACVKSATREWNLQRSIGAPENVYTSLKMGRTHGMDKGMGWISEMMAWNGISGIKDARNGHNLQVCGYLIQETCAKCLNMHVNACFGVETT